MIVEDDAKLTAGVYDAGAGRNLELKVDEEGRWWAMCYDRLDPGDEADEAEVVSTECRALLANVCEGNLICWFDTAEGTADERLRCMMTPQGVRYAEGLLSQPVRVRASGLVLPDDQLHKPGGP